MMMRQSTVRFGLMMALMALPLLKASALTVQIQLTADNIKQQKVAFQITNQYREGLRQVIVTVSPKAEALSPGLLARLTVSDGTTTYAMVPVEEKREGANVTYWFRVAPNLLGKSKFEFDVLSGKEEKDADGKTHFVAIPGTIEYWFYVGEFVTPKGLARSEKTTPSHATKTHG
jgi:hypothetical protein